MVSYSYGADSSLCSVMSNIANQMQSSVYTQDVCSVSNDCREVNCTSIDNSVLSISLSCSPSGVTLTSVNNSVLPPAVATQVFSSSGVFQGNYRVTVDRKTSRGFGFSLALIEGHPDFSLDFDLVTRVTIPTIGACGVQPVTTGTAAPPTNPLSYATQTVPTEPASDSSTASTTSTSHSPSTDSTTTPPSTNHSIPKTNGTTTCNTMNKLFKQMDTNMFFVGGYFCTQYGCGEISCHNSKSTLTLDLSCVPVGVELEYVENSRTHTHVFTESGMFDNTWNVTVHNYQGEVIGFALEYIESRGTYHPYTITYTIVDMTYIPLDYCDALKGLASKN